MVNGVPEREDQTMTTTNHDEITEAVIVEEPRHLPTIHRPESAMTLFGTSNPAEALQRAIEIATPLAALIKDRGLSKNLGGDKDHVQIEGWQTLGGMLGLSVDTAWTRKVTDPAGEWAPPTWHLEQQEKPSKFKRGETYMADVKVIDTPGKGGWEARVEVRRPDGSQAGTGEMECRWDERNWLDSDSYALRSMAQTRAASKAYRQALGFVMVLAGFSATPAEEMDGVAAKPHSDGTADQAEYRCPACGAGLYDQRDQHEADPKKPAWKCSNRDCQGGNPKKEGGGCWPWASWHTEPPHPPEHPLARLQWLVSTNYTGDDLKMADRVIDEACSNLGLIRDTIDDSPTLNRVWTACFDVAVGWDLIQGAAPMSNGDPTAEDLRPADDPGRPFE